MSAMHTRLSRRAALLLSAAAVTVGGVAAAVPGAAHADDTSLLRAAVAAAPSAREIITVSAPSTSSTTAQLSAWIPGSSTWTRVFGPINARLGSQGMGVASDTVPRTPMGVFGLDEAFGRQPNPGTSMPYSQVTARDWWDGNPKSPTYDRHVVGADPGPGSENLYNAGPVYDYAVHFNENPTHTPGKGSAFFLHVTDGTPTEGCVAVDRASMIALLKWLNPAYQPVISIGL
ncbi:L,D-transpeptidase family protein [Tsukamurella soli]|uniref:L,D-TPase catalytic domain-containing protein n=1 Tax=Tsukamurella soli TaxID=644556 RepID=A0ABP8JAG7_9ACTN